MNTQPRDSDASPRIVSLIASAVGFVAMLGAYNTTTILLSVAFFVFSNSMIRPHFVQTM